MEHTKGPWKQHEGEDGKLYANVRAVSGRCVADCGSRTDKEAQANARLIAGCPTMYEACKNAVQRMDDSPVQACGEWQTGLFCGLEDRNITDRYDACMYGYEKALERVQEWIIDEIEAAIAKATE